MILHLTTLCAFFGTVSGAMLSDIFTPFDIVEVKRFAVVAAPLPPRFSFMDCIGTADEISTCAADFANPKPLGYDHLIIEVRLERLELGVSGLAPLQNSIFSGMLVELDSDSFLMSRLNDSNCTRPTGPIGPTPVVAGDSNPECLYSQEKWRWAVSTVSILTVNKFVCVGGESEADPNETVVPLERCIRNVYITLSRMLPDERD